MLFPDYRPRRLRQNEAFRRMIRETRLAADDLILPLFAIKGRNVRNPIESMPGHFQLSVDQLIEAATSAKNLGIPAVMLFGIPDAKDPLGTRAYAADGIVQTAVKALKDRLSELNGPISGGPTAAGMQARSNPARGAGFLKWIEHQLPEQKMDDRVLEGG